LNREASIQGILPIDKPAGITSFKLVSYLRKILNVKKIGHAGTLDPFATGVMLLMVGKQYTSLSNQLMASEKEYVTTIRLGIETDTHDTDGKVIATSDYIPTLEEIQENIIPFQGWQEQIPSMFSAKKINGKKLYELARQGIEIPRPPSKVHMQIELLNYSYPFLEIKVNCTPGTYIRSLARDLGLALNCGAHLAQLRRTRSGTFTLKECFDGNQFQTENTTADQLIPWLRSSI